jgi:hypothetical protein
VQLKGDVRELPQLKGDVWELPQPSMRDTGGGGDVSAEERPQRRVCLVPIKESATIAVGNKTWKIDCSPWPLPLLDRPGRRRRRDWTGPRTPRPSIHGNPRILPRIESNETALGRRGGGQTWNTPAEGLDWPADAEANAAVAAASMVPETLAPALSHPCPSDRLCRPAPTRGEDIEIG